MILFDTDLTALIASHGYWWVGGLVALESMGILVPGELALVTAALYAGHTHNLDIGGIIAACFAGAVIGDNAGYGLGRWAGHGLLIRYGRYVGLSPARIRLGRYLFTRHGGKLVFFARFTAILRAAAGPLAGAARMPWPRFTAFNIVGAALWVTSYGFAAYYLGDQAVTALSMIGKIALGLALIAIIILWRVMRRQYAAWQAEADRTIPDDM